MNYVRCINNDAYSYSLQVGAVYCVLPPEPNDGDLLRMLDETADQPGNENGYLFSLEYFILTAEDDIPAATYTQIKLKPGVFHSQDPTRNWAKDGQQSVEDGG